MSDYMGRTLHNVKASLMLCFWLYEPRKFIKLIRNNVGSECLRVWHNYIPGCVARVYYILMHTFPGDQCYILAWVLLCFVHQQRFSQDLYNGQAEVDTHLFIVWSVKYKTRKRLILGIYRPHTVLHYECMSDKQR